MTNRPFAMMTLLVVLGTTLMAVPSLAFNGILTGSGAFQTSGLWTTNSLAWDVQQDTAGFFHYNYRLLVPDGAPSVDEILLEVDPSVTSKDIFGTTGNVVVGDFFPADNPNMPRSIHAIGFLHVNQNRTSFDFDSFKSPVWGDFYAKSGGGNPSTVFNSGFTNPDTDPTDPPSNGTINNSILRVGPTSAVPDSSTIVLVCFGTLQILAVRKRIFKKAGEH